METISDIYESDTESQNVIVDIAVLEAAKENIQPLAKGRRVTSLASVLATPHAQRDARLSATRARHRANVETALEAAQDEDREDDDIAGIDTPLEAYARFVHWTIEHYPRGHSAESGILELLEEATRVLKDEGGGRNRSDKRYLDLWVLYAGYVDRPTLVYSFCLANDIGATHSLLYEEYAAVLEKCGNKTKADEIYALGIARNAEPVERLQNKYREFQKRMMISTSSSSNSIVSTASTGSSAGNSSSTTTQRQALRTQRKPTTSCRAQRQDDVFTAPRTSTTSAPRPNARMAIFVDPDGKADNQDGKTANPWPELEPKKVRVKENVRAATKMAGTTLKGKKGSATSKATPTFSIFVDPEGEEDEKHEEERREVHLPSAQSFVPFVDPEERARVPATPKFVPFRDETATSSPTGCPVPETVMKPKMLRDSSEAEALRKNPFKNYEEGERPVLEE